MKHSTIFPYLSILNKLQPYYLIAQNGDSRKKLLLQHKHILQFKLENKKLVKKNIVYLRKMKKDFIKEI